MFYTPVKNCSLLGLSVVAAQIGRRQRVALAVELAAAAALVDAVTLALTAPEGVTVFVPAQAHSNTKPKAVATTLSTGFLSSLLMLLMSASAFLRNNYLGMQAT